MKKSTEYDMIGLVGLTFGVTMILYSLQNPLLLPLLIILTIFPFGFGFFCFGIGYTERNRERDSFNPRKRA